MRQHDNPRPQRQRRGRRVVVEEPIDAEELEARRVRREAHRLEAEQNAQNRVIVDGAITAYYDGMFDVLREMAAATPDLLTRSYFIPQLNDAYRVTTRLLDDMFTTAWTPAIMADLRGMNLVSPVHLPMILYGIFKASAHRRAENHIDQITYLMAEIGNDGIRDFRGADGGNMLCGVLISGDILDDYIQPIMDITGANSFIREDDGLHGFYAHHALVAAVEHASLYVVEHALDDNEIDFDAIIDDTTARHLVLPMICAKTLSKCKSDRDADKIVRLVRIMQLLVARCDHAAVDDVGNNIMDYLIHYRLNDFPGIHGLFAVLPNDRLWLEFAGPPNDHPVAQILRDMRYEIDVVATVEQLDALADEHKEFNMYLNDANVLNNILHLAGIYGFHNTAVLTWIAEHHAIPVVGFGPPGAGED